MIPLVCEVPLSKGERAVVDVGDYANVSRHSWHLQSQGYAGRTVKNEDGTRSYVLMHREILDAPDDLEVDHINGDRVDNRRSNLRLCTRGQNAANHARFESRSSPFRGVTFSKARQKWHVKYSVDGQTINIGRFSDPIKAAVEYDKAVVRERGDFARPNCPIMKVAA